MGIPCGFVERAGAAGCEMRIEEDVARGDDAGRGRRGVPCVLDVSVGAAVCEGGRGHVVIGVDDAGRRGKLLLPLPRAVTGFGCCWDIV